jgi:hypothetical protein
MKVKLEAASKLWLGLHLEVSFLSNSCLPPSKRNPSDSMDPTWIIQNNLPLTMLTLLTSAKSPSPHKAAFTEPRDQNMDIFRVERTLLSLPKDT